jgi:hypothetical protein
MSRKILVALILFSAALLNPITTLAADDNQFSRRDREVLVVCVTENRSVSLNFKDLTRLEINNKNYKYRGDLAVVVGNKQTGQSVLYYSFIDNTNLSINVSGSINSWDPGIVTIPPSSKEIFFQGTTREYLSAPLGNLSYQEATSQINSSCYR